MLSSPRQGVEPQSAWASAVVRATRSLWAAVQLVPFPQLLGVACGSLQSQKQRASAARGSVKLPATANPRISKAPVSRVIFFNIGQVPFRGAGAYRLVANLLALKERR